MKISAIHGREILDSRGHPTVEAEITLANGITARAAVPSGASTGSREAVELRDGGSRYQGKGVTKAVAAVNGEIADKLKGIAPDQQQQIDRIMIDLDGTNDKSRLGANAILAVSLATTIVAAKARGIALYRHIADLYQGDAAMTMPVPMMNIVNGGMHADNSIDFQEFMIQPVAFNSFSEALRCGAEIFHTLKGVLRERGLQTAVGDEGGFAPNLESTNAVLEVVSESVDKAGYRLGTDVMLALDCAATEFYSADGYKLENRLLSSDQMVDYIVDLCQKHPITSVEDGLAEDDWVGWKKLTERLGDKVQLVGDDLFVTNTAILQQGIDQKVANLNSD